MSLTTTSEAATATNAVIAAARTDQFETSVDFGPFALAATYHLTGKYRAAVADEPADYPTPVIDRCVLSCGDWQTSVDFELLAEPLRERVLDECVMERCL